MTNPKKVSEAHEHELTLAELKSERTRLDLLIADGTAKRADATRLHRVLQSIRHIESAQSESAAT
jgi:hypothetical protein